MKIIASDLTFKYANMPLLFNDIASSVGVSFLFDLMSEQKMCHIVSVNCSNIGDDGDTFYHVKICS